MSHEITNSDHVVLATQSAWHGLGTVVEEAPTPAEAIKLARLDWEVEQWPMTATNGEVRRSVESHVLNVRSDSREPLGVVGSGYKPVQNLELAEFATLLAKEGDVTRIETAGSIKAGRRVWFLVRGQSFSAGPEDVIGTYVMIGNGHDGGLSVRIFPTSVRVVCANTFHYALSGVQRKYDIRFRHEGNITEKINEARRALGLYVSATERYQDQVNALAAAVWTKEQIDEFVVEALTLTEGTIPKQPKNKSEQRKRDRAVEAYRQICQNFDADRQKTGAGPNAWTAFNAVTQWQQHQRKIRAKDETVRTENRVYTDMFGSIGGSKVEAFDLALSKL